MKLKLYALSTLAFGILPYQACHAELTCNVRDGYRVVDVAGTATTVNLSATKQVGTICLTFNDEKGGKQVFNECGSLIGTATAVDATTGSPTEESHLAAFNNFDIFKTTGDMPAITGVVAFDASGAPCAVSVIERFTQLAWGTGIFRGGDLDVTGTGEVRFCSILDNRNTFTLSGKACVRK